MALSKTVDLALKDQAPELHAELAKAGSLRQYVDDLSSQISSASVTATQEQRLREKWDNLGSVECAAKMRAAQSLHLEAALADLLQFPQDGTSASRPDETTGSPTKT